MRQREPRDESRALERRETGFVAADGIVISYRVVRSARRRRTLELTLQADGVRVAAPVRTSQAEIAAFVRSRIPWIRKHSTRPAPRPPVRFASGDSVPYLGRRVPIECVEDGGRTVRVRMDLLGVRVALPRRGDEGHEHLVEQALRDWYRERAAEEISTRVATWSARAGRHPRRVMIRDQKRRWGSCAKDGTLRFNWRLVMMDPDIIDYVVVHEIAHLAHPHHQRSFWAEVERLLPDHRERRRALREAGALLPL